MTMKVIPARWRASNAGCVRSFGFQTHSPSVPAPNLRLWRQNPRLPANQLELRLRGVRAEKPASKAEPPDPLDDHIVFHRCARAHGAAHSGVLRRAYSRGDGPIPLTRIPGKH